MFKELIIYSNRLNVLQKYIFKDFISKTNTNLEIYNNNFICDCDMYWLANMTGEIKSSIYTQNDICTSNILNKTSLQCFIKKITVSGKCPKIDLSICNNG